MYIFTKAHILFYLLVAPADPLSVGLYITFAVFDYGYISQVRIIFAVFDYGYISQVSIIFAADYPFVIIKLLSDIYKGYKSISKHIKEYTYL
jgi:hypothetical protein